MKFPSGLPKLLLVAALILLSFSRGCCRKMLENVGHQEVATVLLSDHSKVAARETFHFHLDYEEAGPNFNGKSGFPFPIPPPLPPPLAPSPQ